ncbi:MAG: CDP-alcohol phosphatidyltransferase family protein [Halobacteriaceae archaeon]
MTLDRFRPYATRVISPIVTYLENTWVTPDTISVISLLLAISAAILFYYGGQVPVLYFGGGLLVFLNGWLDILDGALARELERDSRAGDLLDHVIDRYADLFMITGLAAGIGRYDLGIAAVTGVFMTSYLGTQAQAVNLNRVYAGLLGRADRIALIAIVSAIAAVRPTMLDVSLIAILLIFFALVGHITALQRFVSAWRALS